MSESSRRGDGKEPRSRKSRFDQPEDKEKKRQEMRSEEKLDPTSSNFDPLKALYTSKSVLSDPKAPVYDNLSKYESVMAGTATTVAVSKRIAKRVEFEDLPVRDLTDTYDNVMKWMKDIDGPMKAIRVCMENKVKVKVITRAASCIRGHVIGYITAFDKVWNLAVEDAVEVWTRKRKRKTLPKGDASVEIPQETQPLRMTAPPIKVTRLPNNSKKEKCERKIEKILLRGEHIVLISIVNY
uniref:U7 snRNA-associated Sm-like protein LSm11 n=1 Tax=Lygus hesperus TaxID=30085 RepID=A0A0A9Y1T6_LYGHE